MHNKCIGLYKNLTEVLFSLPLQIVGDGLLCCNCIPKW